ncbi:adenine phosphoribosyltransferase [Bacteroides thetaiotaomicron]|uniref:adenine phosphoribosyltransferase n=1 Tax=Bacteroides thetaiotaomicron TaxID=818 RepID=UPI0032C0E000
MTKYQNAIELSRKIRNIPNFPEDGIQFKDITPLLNSNDSFRLLSEILLEKYENKGITKVVGIESRGFWVGTVLALGLNAGFVPIRKPGKLPCKVVEKKYEKEYGYDSLQIHEDALTKEDVVLIHDDLLATGGTMLAAYDLVKGMGVKQIYINFIVELELLKGRANFPLDTNIISIIKL